jgi:hypothetical protein
MFSCLSPEARVPQDHPLRAIRRICDGVLAEMSGLFTTIYSKIGPAIGTTREIVARPVAASALHRAQRTDADGATGLQPIVLFRWFVGLNMDEAVWQ